jgi:hypothetical protein
MSRAEVINKARDLTAPILGYEAWERLIEVIETVADLRGLRPLLQRG